MTAGTDSKYRMPNSMNRQRLPLGALDFVKSIEESVELAPALEAIGYSRYWIAEHPPQPNPQITVGILAGLTHTMRVGTAGIVLKYQNPLQVALNFWLLQSLFPDRIDAGFCNAGVNTTTAKILLDGRTAENEPFEKRANSLVRMLRNEFPPELNLTQDADEAHQSSPEIWGLGSGTTSAQVAAENGIAYAFSLWLGGDNTAPMQHYRTHFRPSWTLNRPRTCLAITGICADSSEIARELADQHKNAFVKINIAGTLEECRDFVATLAKRYQMDELVFLDLCQEYRDRLRSYQLMFKACSSIEG